MLVLGETTISTLLRNLTSENAARLLDELSTALALYTLQKSGTENVKLIYQPLRSSFVTKDQNTTLVMPVSNTTNTGVKVVTVPQRGDIRGAITIYRPNGELSGVLNAAEITAFRTALATMALLKYWKGTSNANLAVFGSGKQAEWHVRLALLLHPEIRCVTVVNRGQQRLDQFDRSTLAELRGAYPAVKFATVAHEGNDRYQTELSELVAEADMIFCCTPSKEPLFTAKHLKTSNPKFRFLSLIGSYKPEMQEVDTETVRLAAKVYVDCKESCLAESGELQRAALSSQDLVEAGDIFGGSASAKETFESESKLTIFKCVGLGLMDLAISSALLDIAKSLGQGTVVDGF